MLRGCGAGSTREGGRRPGEEAGKAIQERREAREDDEQTGRGGGREDHGHGPNVLKLGLVGFFYVMGLCLCTLGQVGNDQKTFTSIP